MAAVTVTSDRPAPRPGPVSPWSFLRFLPAPQPLVVARLRRSGTGPEMVARAERPAPGRDALRASYLVSLPVGPRRRVPMRLEIEGWSAAATRVEMVPLRRVRPGPRYLRAGHRFLDTLTRVAVGG